MRSTIQGGLIEQLESRQLRSATVDLAGDQLTITGTEANDVIVIALNAADPAQLDVKLGKETTSYPVADISRITVNALGGNDKITVREKNGAVYASLVVYGGEGNDSIVTGSGNDILDGGSGNDKVTGGSGDDVITGGEGNDTLIGGDGDDQLDAGDGRDKVTGGLGDDNLDGAGGKDTIKAGDGEDRIAVDDENTKELRRRGDSEITEYEVAAVEDLPPELSELLDGLDTELPGFHVLRAEVESTAGHYSIYYTFGDDPDVYKVVVELIEGELELVNRQVSLAEARDVAKAAFADDHPDVEILSLFQHPGSVWDVRCRTADGTIQTITTEDIIWGIDDLESDVDNDGRNDNFHGPSAFMLL